ncbi:MAG TPA: Yip1 family protein [Methylocystis sp.]|nr:Yip1 family protein [Methylocystis sp.]
MSPEDEWAVIESEGKTVPQVYREYVLLLALIPPFAGFLGGYLFGFGHATGLAGLSLQSGLLRAALQYALSLPLLYVVAFVLSSLAPHFDGRSDDTRALTLAAYSYTPAWLAAVFGLAPGLRWLDVLGFYGVLVFYHGLPRMLKVPKENADVFTLAALVLTIATAALHAWIVRLAAPWSL